MRKLTVLPFVVFLTGCGASATSYVHTPNDTTLGRVVVYRNGVAYFERTADVKEDHLDLQVPADKVDDFLKSLTVVDAQTGAPAPITYPTKPPTSITGLIDMRIGLAKGSGHKLKLSYVTEAPSWKPSYRVVIGANGKVNLEAWAIVDNTSGEDWNNVKLGVGSSSALSFRFDLRSVRLVERETLQQNDLFAYAPPVGGSTYGNEAIQKKLVADVDDSTLAQAEEQEKYKDEATKTVAGNVQMHSAPPPPVTISRGPGNRPTTATSAPYGGYGGGHGAAAQSQPQLDSLQRMARSLQSTSDQIVVEGFAAPNDGDKNAASLARANKMREQLVRNGVDPNQIVAVGRGEQTGRSGGVRVVEAPRQTQQGQGNAAKAGGDNRDGTPDKNAVAAADPIGTSHFESGSVTSVARGTSAMVSIMHTDTEGEVVYLYDPESARGNAQFPFKSVRLKNPSDSALETGPVTVFGEGRFIGEGMAEPIPARSTAFVPFALDRQIVVDKGENEEDAISRIITVQRGVFSTEVQHTKKTTFTLSNRLGERAVVYVRHTIAQGYKLSKTNTDNKEEKLGPANLFRVVLEPHSKGTVEIEEQTPVFRTIDVRTPAGIEQVRFYLSKAAVEGPLKNRIEDLLKYNKDMADIEQKIQTTREQMSEYRERMDELHNQIFTLKAVKTAGPLMQNLEKKMSEISDRLSKSTIDVVTLQEQLMVARVHFQDGVADLSLEKKDDKDKKAVAAAK
jgi:outer membrane protein OmpA-like peptidoglycan-associated protein